MKKIVFAVIFVVLSVSIAFACYIKKPVQLSGGKVVGYCSNNDRGITCVPGDPSKNTWCCITSQSYCANSKEEAVDKACGCD